MNQILDIGCYAYVIDRLVILASITLVPLAAFASTQTNCLSILLQLGDQGITVLHNIRILLVLIVGSVGLDDAVDPVDGA